MLVVHYFVPWKASKNCDEYVCLLVCLFARMSQKTTRQTSHQILMYVACGRGSVLPWRRCDVLCTSGFVGEVTF